MKGLRPAISLGRALLYGPSHGLASVRIPPPQAPPTLCPPRGLVGKAVDSLTEGPTAKPWLSPLNGIFQQRRQKHLSGGCPAYIPHHPWGCHPGSYCNERRWTICPPQHLTYWTLDHERWLCLFIELLWLNAKRGSWWELKKKNLLWGIKSLSTNCSVTSQYLRKKNSAKAIFIWYCIRFSVSHWVLRKEMPSPEFDIWS